MHLIQKAVEEEEVDPILAEHQAFLDELKTLQEAKTMCDFFGVEPTIVKLLGKEQ